TEYLVAAEVSHHVAQLASSIDALPDHPFVRAAWLTQAIGAIHPFRDSNGGTSRFLCSIELSRASLPPFTLTRLLREGPYVPALMLANQHQLWPLLEIFYESIHQTLAKVLLSGVGNHASWSSEEDARTARWASSAGSIWQSALGFDAAKREVAVEIVLGRLARRGARFPIVPDPRCSEWYSNSPMPLQLDLAITPMRGGDETWLVASIDASLDDGELAANVDREPVATYFVAPSNEPDEIVDARFTSWCSQRARQCVRGLARWM
ncbi:MAG: Fic family protein, partial [Kofleriaceae bacterium]